MAVSGAEPAERHLVVEHSGATARVQELGAGEPVVFVHGAPNGGTSWAALAARLEGFRCVIVDRPGCGLSPRGDVRHADMDELGTFADAFVVDVLDAMDLPGPTWSAPRSVATSRCAPPPLAPTGSTGWSR